MKESSHLNATNVVLKIQKKSDLIRHMKSVHEGIMPFKCNICDHKTAQKSNLKQNIESVHGRIILVQ